jgi:hypothetical protein
MSRTRCLLVVLVLTGVAAGLCCSGDEATGPAKTVISISPDSAVVEISASQGFQVVTEGEVPDVTWFVGTREGGAASTGVIDMSGLFIAPASVPADSVVIVKAVADDDADLSATARVLIRGGSGTSYVRALPADTSLAPGEPVVFGREVVGCAGDDVTWSVDALSAGAGDVGSIGPDGSYAVPTSVTASVRLLVRAASVNCADKTGIAVVTVTPPVEFEVELEDYTAWHDDENGSSYISAQACSKASGYRMVKGLDYPGEWIEVPFTVPVYGAYEVVLRYATMRGDTLRATVTFDGCGSALADDGIDFVMDQGEGLG